MDLDDLLDDDKALLDEDFEQLGLATATNREFWVASMEVAILTAGCKRRRDSNMIDNKHSENHVLSDPEFDNEGSLSIGNDDENESNMFVSSDLLRRLESVRGL